MKKDETYNLRWDSDLKARTQKFADDNKQDMATVIREAIEEKINPEYRIVIGRKIFSDCLVQDAKTI